MLFMLLQAAVALRLSNWPMQPSRPSPCEVVRYCYEGGTLRRDGRLLHGSMGCGEDVIAALKEDGADLARFSPRIYDPALQGWSPLLPATEFANGSSTHVDVMLFQHRRHEEAAARGDVDGYFAIGVFGLKNSHNLGTLWRSAYQNGAASLFVVGERYTPQTSDTVKAWRSVPLVQHADWNSFAAASPYGALWVAVEMGGEPLADFEHPERAMYVLGSEDTGLPSSVLKACHRTVSLPSLRTESFNLAVAGAVVLYDRLAKQQRKSKS